MNHARRQSGLVRLATRAGSHFVVMRLSSVARNGTKTVNYIQTSGEVMVTTKVALLSFCIACAFHTDVGAQSAFDNRTRNSKVSDQVVRGFEKSAQPQRLTVVVRGHEVPPFFYRPVIDDTPSQRRAAVAQVRALLAHRGVTPRNVDPDKGIVVFDGDANLTREVANLGVVHGITGDMPLVQALSNAVNVANFSPLYQAGFGGMGKKIAIIDFGFTIANVSNPVLEECFSTANSCNGTNRRSGPGAAFTSITNSHGNESNQVAGGSASGATLVAIAAPQLDAVYQALDWIAAQDDISVVSLSIGVFTSHNGSCDSDPAQSAWLQRIDALHDRGIAVVVAAGNDNSATDPTRGYRMNSPACLTQTISVANSWDCDGNIDCPQYPAASTIQFNETSLSSARTDLIAPGGPYTLYNTDHNQFVDRFGTSLSAPLVAGCAAILHQWLPGIGPESLRGAFRSSQTWITRDYTNLAYPRLDCGQAKTFASQNAGIRPDQRGIVGPWFNNREPGQGFLIEYIDYANLVVGGWFTFDKAPAGSREKQRWLTFAGTPPARTQPRIVSVEISENVGGNFDAPPETTALPVGTGKLHFSTCTTGALQYNITIDGQARSGFIPLSRATPPVACSTDGRTLSPQDNMLSGAWLELGTSGQGILFEVNPVNNQFGATWYTYAKGVVGDAKRQRWYTMQMPYVPQTWNRSISNIPISETTGGVFDSAMPVVDTATVGQASITFHSCTSATLTYAFPGRLEGSGTLNLTRGGAPAGCFP